jgi:glycerol uptake facilitator-like aquaporin
MASRPATRRSARPPDPPGRARTAGNPVPRRTLIGHSAFEFFLTFVLLFGVVTIVRWVIGPSAVARAVPHIHLQLLIIGGAIALLGTASGGSENPARQLGPAIASGQTRFLWAYLLAPMLAAVLAAAARRAIQPARQVMTHRLGGPAARLRYRLAGNRGSG